MTIGVRFRRDLEGPWSPWIRVPGDDIDAVMKMASLHFCEHPLQQLGGPQIPVEKKT